MKTQNDAMNEDTYEALLAEIDTLQKKGEATLTAQELSALRELALKAQTYEEQHYPVPAPKTLVGMIELRLYEMKLRQRDAAKLLGVREAKLSLILSGKQKPDLAFLKAVHKHLSIPADFILAAA